MVNGDPSLSLSQNEEENDVFDASIDPYDDQQDFGYDDGIRNHPRDEEDDDYDDDWDDDTQTAGHDNSSEPVLADREDYDELDDDP